MAKERGRSNVYVSPATVAQIDALVEHTQREWDRLLAPKGMTVPTITVSMVVEDAVNKLHHQVVERKES